jgi:hypothetical protein
MNWLRRNFLTSVFARRRAPAIAPKASAGREVWPAEGYSLLELERAGISAEQAEAMGVPVDLERHSSLGSNVIQLERLVEQFPGSARGSRTLDSHASSVRSQGVGESK